MSISGKWQKLTYYLKSRNDAEIILTDDDIQQIVDSNDNTRPYSIDFPNNPKYSITQRAADAGYNVNYNSSRPRI